MGAFNVIIDERYLDTEAQGKAFVDALRAVGAQVSVHRLEDIYCGTVQVPDKGAFIHGSIAFVRAFERFPPDGGPFFHYLRTPLCQVSHYQHLIPAWLRLNANAVFAPLAEVSRRLNDWPEVLGSQRFFIKPDSTLKPFEGFIVDPANPPAYLGEICERHDGSTMCLLGPDLSIDSEYRFVVANGEIVAGSRYINRGGISYGDWTTIPPEVIDGANACLRSMTRYPDTLFTLDMALRPSGQCRVIELNAFSTSGLYKTDKHEVAKAWRSVSQAALTVSESLLTDRIRAPRIVG